MLENEMLKKMRAHQFVENNGRVLRTINLLRHSYERLKDVRAALDDINEGRFLDSVNFLVEAGYIKLRDCSDKAPAELADCNYENLEAKVSAQGIRLLGGQIKDEMVDA